MLVCVCVCVVLRVVRSGVLQHLTPLDFVPPSSKCPSNNSTCLESGSERMTGPLSSILISINRFRIVQCLSSFAAKPHFAHLLRIVSFFNLPKISSTNFSSPANRMSWPCLHPIEGSVLCTQMYGVLSPNCYPTAAIFLFAKSSHSWAAFRVHQSVRRSCPTMPGVASSSGKVMYGSRTAGGWKCARDTSSTGSLMSNF